MQMDGLFKINTNNVMRDLLANTFLLLMSEDIWSNPLPCMEVAFPLPCRANPGACALSLSQHIAATKYTGVVVKPKELVFIGLYISVRLCFSTIAFLSFRNLHFAAYQTRSWTNFTHL